MATVAGQKAGVVSTKRRLLFYARYRLFGYAWLLVFCAAAGGAFASLAGGAAGIAPAVFVAITMLPVGALRIGLLRSGPGGVVFWLAFTGVVPAVASVRAIWHMILF